MPNQKPKPARKGNRRILPKPRSSLHALIRRRHDSINTENSAALQYRRQKKEKNLSVQFVLLTQELRQRLNQTGHHAQRLFQVADGSFCNRTVLREDWEAQNVSVVVRCRKDIVLCKRAPGKGRRFYGQTKFTPQQVRRRDS